MHLRRRLVLAPRWAHALILDAYTAACFTIPGLAFSFGTPWWAISAVAVVGVAVWVLLGGEDKQRRQLIRKIGWTGYPLAAALARADVDAGLIPEENATRRELARRCTTELRGRARLTQVMAVVTGLLCLGLVVLAAITGDGGGLALVYLVIAIGPQYQALVRLPRHRKVHTRLGENDADWAAITGHHPGSTFTTDAPKRPDRR